VDALWVGLIAQGGALIILAGTIWSQSRHLRRTLEAQRRTHEEQLAAQAEQLKLQLEHAASESRDAWLRERHDRVSVTALEIATEAAKAFTAAKGAVSAGRDDAEEAERQISLARKDREALRHAHSRLSMVAPAPAEVLIDIREHVQHFEHVQPRAGDADRRSAREAAGVGWVTRVRPPSRTPPAGTAR
jgi:DNA repair exonuclease SbcCD ATPase subunit